MTIIKTSRYILMQGDCLERLKKLPDNSVDSVVTDPPYGISFMAKKWDHSVPSVEVWQECMRVLKPGGHMLVACGTRTQHRMVVNIEDAGFEIRDVVTWLYGSGFPKSLDISKAIDKEAGAEREVVGINTATLRPNRKATTATTEAYGTFDGDNGATVTAPATDAAKQWQGFGTALKPACEFFTLCRKPLSESTVAKNVLKHGTGGLNIDGCRVGSEIIEQHRKPMQTWRAREGRTDIPASADYSVATTEGRFPANLILDDEAAQALDEQTGNTESRFFYCAKASQSERNAGLEGRTAVKVNDGRQTEIDNPFQRGEKERLNTHPTVKPIKLMAYLCRLITPPGGKVLDPFMGSGSTGIAALQEGYKFIGCELDADYLEISRQRLEHETLSQLPVLAKDA